jgi:hypothetical protein
MAITLLQLRTQARQRANMENSTFVTDGEFNTYINLSISELYDMLCSKSDADYNISSSTFTTVTNQDSYNLPVDFYRLRGVDLLIDPLRPVPLKRFEFAERNSIDPQFYGVVDIRYRLRGDKLTFTPTELMGGQSMRIWYIPLPTQLSADNHTLNGYNGWEELVIVKTAIKALVKEEQDTSQLTYEYEQLKLRLEQAMDSRDSASPSRITDNERYFYPYDIAPRV